MKYKPDSIINRMNDESMIVDRAIDRVIDYWDDKVSEHIRASTINVLTRSANNIVNDYRERSDIVLNLLDEMEMYARR